MITTITQWGETRVGLPYRWLFVLLSVLAFHVSKLEAQELVWAKHLNGTGGNADVFGDDVYAMAKDKDGNVYITGQFRNTVDFDSGPGTDTLSAPVSNGDPFLAKYDADGNYLWAKRIMTGNTSGESIGTNNSIGSDVAVDADGNVYVVGRMSYTAHFETNTGTDSIVLTGTQNAFLCKYSGDGNLAWIKAFPSTVASTNVLDGSASYGCAIGHSGAIYVVGRLNGTTNFNPGGTSYELTSLGTNINAYIAKYDTTGSCVWARGILGTGQMATTSQTGMSIATDTAESEDKLYITGMIRGGTFDFDPGPGSAELTGSNAFYLAKYDAAGNYVWANKAEPGNANAVNRAMGNDLAVDLHGNILVTGYIMGSADFDPGPGEAMVTASGIMDMFLAKYDTGGNYVWAQATQGAGATTGGKSVALDASGVAYVSGSFSGGSVDFDPGPGSVTIMPSSDGYSRGYIAQYGTCGTLLSVTAPESISASSISYFAPILIGKDSNVYVAGDFQGSVDFEPGPSTTILVDTNGNPNIALAKYHFTPDSSLTSFIDTSVCGDSFTLNDQTYTQSGTYQQWLPGITTCDSFVMLSLSISQIEQPIITVNGFVLGLTNTYDTYQWIKDGTPIAGATSPSYTVTENGSYSVSVTSGAQCDATSAPYVVTNATGIADISGPWSQVQVYPNPAGNTINIKSPVKVNAVLYSIEGREILKADNATVISLRGLANGIYMMKLKDKGGNVLLYEKVIKQAQ